MGRRANDEGSIWRRADGRYSGAYFIPTPNGGRARKYVYGTSRQDVHDKLIQLMAHTARGLLVASTAATVQTYLLGWLDEVAATRVRANTLTGYRTNIVNHINPTIGRRRLAKLDAELVRLKTPERAETRVLTVDEARHLLKATKDDRFFASLVLLVVLGLRRSEALGLRWCDIDLDAGVLHVRQGQILRQVASFSVGRTPLRPV